MRWRQERNAASEKRTAKNKHSKNSFRTDKILKHLEEPHPEKFAAYVLLREKIGSAPEMTERNPMTEPKQQCRNQRTKMLWASSSWPPHFCSLSRPEIVRFEAGRVTRQVSAWKDRQSTTPPSRTALFLRLLCGVMCRKERLGGNPGGAGEFQEEHFRRRRSECGSLFPSSFP